MKRYEDLNHISENREPQRAYYIPDGSCTMLNGIFRDVYLLSRPLGHIKDINITTDENVINFSHYTTRKLMEATHINELVKDDSTNIRIDYKNSGVGSNSCGPKLLEKYRLAEKEINFEFYIK